MNWRRYFDLYDADEPLVSEPIGRSAIALIFAGLLIGLAIAGMA